MSRDVRCQYPGNVSGYRLHVSTRWKWGLVGLPFFKFMSIYWAKLVLPILQVLVYFAAIKIHPIVVCWSSCHPSAQQQCISLYASAPNIIQMSYTHSQPLSLKQVYLIQGSGLWLCTGRIHSCPTSCHSSLLVLWMHCSKKVHYLSQRSWDKWCRDEACLICCTWIN